MSGPPKAGITERITIPVKGGVEDWKEPFKQLLLSFKKQPGYLRTRWGPWTENPQMLDIMAGWETREARDEFDRSAAWTNALAQMQQVMDGPLERYFIKFVPYAPKKAVDSPICEMITYKDCSGDEAELRATIEKCKQFDGLNDCASGYSLYPADGAGRLFVGALGWQSLEQSKAANKSVYLPKAGKPEIHHVNFNFPIKGFSVTN